VLVAATVVSTWQAVRATLAETQALAAESQAKTEALRATTAGKLAAEETERTKAALAEATSKFMTDLFTSSRPGEEKGGREVKVVDVLDPAVAALEANPDIPPARRAELQETLGATCDALGLYPQAIPLQEKVRDHQLGTHGPEHPETLMTIEGLVIFYYTAGRKDEAQALRREHTAVTAKTEAKTLTRASVT
jgi:hypothetical protein